MRKIVLVVSGLAVVSCSVDWSRAPDPAQIPTASALGCEDGQHVEWRDGAWACGDASGVDEATVDGFVEDNGYADAASVDARLAAMEARLAALEAAQCPRGFTHAPEGDHDVCTRTFFGVTDEMVEVGDFWIDRYEMSVCPGSGELGGATGGDEMGGATTTAAACSVAGVEPQASITWFQAAQMCANAGKRLCTNAEWQTAVSGTETEEEECNVSSDGTPARTGSHTDCVSRFGAYDMVGNVSEWAADWFAAAGKDDLTEAADEAWGATYGSDGIWNIAGTANDPDSGGWGHRRPAAALRGGNWEHGAKAGAFALYLSLAPSGAIPGVGGRCCAGVR